MQNRPQSRRFLRLFALLAVAVTLVMPAHAGSAVTADDLQAAIRTLGFLDTLPHNGTAVIGIVYGEGAGGQSLAAEAARMFNSLPKPGSIDLRAEAISVAQISNKLGALYLMPGISTDKEVVAGVQRQRLVSISKDPACLDAKSCVLLVRTDNGVEIILDTALADAAGARFSSVFAIMVKRK